ncbi:GPW/gp25 family protein [Marinobacterium sp. YM272]|uniref:GPW/gp25 family protein n=1 Tax=Marinobacterium sp. YM272 TaxID=3421654 RepID=UPI003D7F9C04
MAAEDQIIGKGWSFPPSFDYARGGVRMTGGIEDIQNSLLIIFTTTLGERVMQPKFGCSLETQLMEPMNSGTLGYIRHLLETAILYHEPRIDAEQIILDVESQPGTLRIEVQYKVRGSNSRFNFVHPFYLNEGSGS